MSVNIKLTILSAFLLASLYSCNLKHNDKELSTDLIQNPISANGKTDTNKLPQITFKTTKHDFGKVIDGVKIAFKFQFTNTGNSDLVIDQVNTSCGCTVSSFSKEAIAPGKTGVVELTFDSSRRKGFNSKTATVLSNAQPNVAELSITATVVEADDL